jgi:hypothetical protein
MGSRQSGQCTAHRARVLTPTPAPTAPQEPPRLKEGGAPPPPGWPASGALTYSDVWASYRPGLPPVLKALSFSLPGNCSCGVVGRTGSGKSSLMLTLFRLISVDQGVITLDGLDTSQVALDVLRRQLAIIPQDPVRRGRGLRDEEAAAGCGACGAAHTGRRRSPGSNLTPFLPLPPANASVTASGALQRHAALQPGPLEPLQRRGCAGGGGKGAARGLAGPGCLVVVRAAVPLLTGAGQQRATQFHIIDAPLSRAPPPAQTCGRCWALCSSRPPSVPPAA